MSKKLFRQSSPLTLASPAGRGRERTKGMRREEGRDVANDNRYVRVYARRGGRWRAVTQMSAPARPAS